jgi:Zn-dependent protease
MQPVPRWAWHARTVAGLEVRSGEEIALAGPVASLAAGGICYGLGAAVHAAGGPAVVVAAASRLAVMNVVLAVFNLLPGEPLDGSRVLRAILWRRWGDHERAARAAARAGQVLGAVIIALGLAEALTVSYLDGLWLVLIGWFLISAATAERPQRRLRWPACGR